MGLKEAITTVHWTDRTEAAQTIIDRTFAEIGIKSFRALKRTVLIRTERPECRVGLIIIPESSGTFYEGMPHLRMHVGTVLAAGPKHLTDVEPGDRVCFQRLHFARWIALGEDQYVGWIDSAQLVGHVEPENKDPKTGKARLKSVP